MQMHKWILIKVAYLELADLLFDIGLLDPCSDGSLCHCHPLVLAPLLISEKEVMFSRGIHLSSITQNNSPCDIFKITTHS